MAVPADPSIFVVRVAAAVLRLPKGSNPMFLSDEARELADSAWDAIGEALLSDPRVKSVPPRSEGARANNARTVKYSEVDDDADDILSTVNDFYGLRLNQPMRFAVHVPRKNQLKYRNIDDVPAETYDAVWDGEFLMVQWEQDSPRRANSGGHVVIEVLAQAVTAAGWGLSQIACTTGCLHRFLHADFVTFADVPDAESFEVPSYGGVGGSVVTPWGKPKDAWENLARMHHAVYNAVGLYTVGRTQADAIMFLERVARADVETLLEVAHRRATRRRFPHIIGSVVDSWNLIGAGRITRELTSELWVALVRLDTLRRAWATTDDRLRRAVNESGLGAVKAVQDIDQDAVRSVELDLLKASVQEISTRRDGRLLALVTFVGALAALSGGLVGALIGG